MSIASHLLSLIPVCVFVMMLCIGLELIPSQFICLLRSPKPLVVGVIAQLLVVPAIGLTMAYVYADTPAIALAIVLIIAAPGGPVANGFVLFAKGRPDVSVALTAINGALALVTTPLVIHLGFQLFRSADSAVPIPLEATSWHIVKIVVLPIAMGMGLRRLLSFQLDKLRTWTRRLATAMLLLIVAAVIGASMHAILDHWGSLALAAVVLCLALLGATTLFAAAVGLSPALQTTLALEVSIHNVPFALFVAERILERGEVSAFIVVYAPTIVLFAFILASVHRARKGAP